MNKVSNPYAPPKAALEDEPIHDYWREGNVLVMKQDSALPARCVKCNEPAVEPMKERRFYWHHPGWYLFILINIVVYAIIAMIVRKKARVAVGLCPKHLLRRRIFLAIGWGSFLFGLAAIFSGLSPDRGDMVLVGISLLLIGIIAGMIGSRIVYPSRITKEEVRLKGCGNEFLDSLVKD